MRRARGLLELEIIRMLDNEPAEAADNDSAAEAENTTPPALGDNAAVDDVPVEEAPARRRSTRRRGTAEDDASGETGRVTRTRRRSASPEPEPIPLVEDSEPGEEELAEVAAETLPEAEAEPEAEDTDAEEVVEEPAEEPEPAPEEPRGRRRPAATVLFMAPEPVAPPARPVRGERDAWDRDSRAEGRAESRPEREESPETEPEQAPAESSRRRRRKKGAAEPVEVAEAVETDAEAEDDEHTAEAEGDADSEHRRRRRGRRGRGRGKGTAEDSADEAETAEEPEAEEEEGEEDEAGEPLTRRRRRRRRKGASGSDAEEIDEDGVPTIVKIRDGRKPSDEVQGVTGSTRLEAKRQRRRDGREQRRTRPPILSEAEFLARREAVDRVMVVRQKGDRTQIGVLEDGVLVEHYVTRASAATMVGNVYLGRVQNVLPSMEAAFVDLGRGRNAVLYAGEVNWDAAGLEGRSRSIEQALKSGDSVLVQVTKDPIGHKGARLSSHIALSGRHLVYVPHGTASGISRKLSDVERRRLRDILKKLVPEGAGVIVRTAAEGASEEELSRDVARLQAQWEEIQAKAGTGGAPALLYSEPDLLVRVVRDLFNEDFKELVIAGSDAYDTVEGYLKHVSPDLVERVHRYTGTVDVFAAYRVDEQLLKGLDRKVFLPSGGHLVIDRTEAMTVIDVNTGKYTGAGGNLEETVTRNNLEAAEEIVRQLRLRDIGGIVVIDFIDMVLESNRELVLRRLTECLGRDRTKHQVTEVTSLGLVQMTRKRIGAGLLEAFSETCEHCKGRGVVIHTEPIAERGSGRGDKGHDKAAGEKVKEVAASVHRDTVADDEEGPAEPDDPFAAEAEVVEDTEELNGDDADGHESDERGGRRRGRRGGARRRTRP
ncbi:Rne/Rng family ribonuclease [Hamadaea sp.]|uniref:Rne/Rng family ribonuclease n=1 Tax=Hamadaea sp. TaxID=2024425 RepID=UPI0025BF0F88|nr:Rne/Rng family ribonuclease [Hamadaea sp.]